MFDSFCPSLLENSKVAPGCKMQQAMKSEACPAPPRHQSATEEA